MKHKCLNNLSRNLMEHFFNPSDKTLNSKNKICDV